MDCLPDDIILHIAGFFYPIELKNLMLVNRQFRDLIDSERFFCMLYWREVKLWDETWKFSLPEEWTWKKVYLWLFKIKRQMISAMYAHMGLIYKYEFRPDNQSICFPTSSENIDDLDLKEKGKIIIFPMRIVYGFNDRSEFQPDFSSIFTIEDMNYFYKTGKCKGFRVGRYNADKLARKKILLREGICIWNGQNYNPIFSIDGLRQIFFWYRILIRDEYEMKLEKAMSLLNEEYTLEYDCKEITLHNYGKLQKVIAEKFLEKELKLMIHGFGWKGLSVMVCRYPKCLLLDHEKGDTLCNIMVYNHLNESLDMKKLLTYPEKDKLELPEDIIIEEDHPLNSEKKRLVLKLLKIDKFPNRIRHVKFDDDEFENPLAEDESNDDEEEDYDYSEGEDEILPGPSLEELLRNEPDSILAQMLRGEGLGSK
jgi:hypothetical protein